MKLLDERSSGVLLHITALPGGEGIGDLGASARSFVDWLERAGQSWWQVLPCTPTDFGDSPYQSPSAYAGNPLLISLRELVCWQLLSDEEVDAAAADSSTANIVDFDRVREVKERLLNLACDRFDTSAAVSVREDFEVFCAAEQQHWLHDFARYSVLKTHNGGIAWQQWPEEYSLRDASLLEQFDEREFLPIRAIKLQQFFFARQWQALRDYAVQRGVGFVGDCPIYVATDSADVWAQPELFDLLPDGQPRVVAGVPPDYFSATGQLWGNPLYVWELMQADNFAWWRSRVRHCGSYFDVTRIDHFRGFDAYWEVPGEAPDASTGCWQPGPGGALLDALAQESVQLIAEDLGDLTPSVHELRKKFDLPGMRVLQFGFDGGHDNPHAPECIGADVVCYVGTHDNNTTLGWYNELDEQSQSVVLAKLNLAESSQLGDALADVALGSAAPLCVLTMQDLLGLDSSARFNTPGTVGSNWSWRMAASDIESSAGAALAEQLLARVTHYQRLNNFSCTNLTGPAVLAAN